MFLKNPSSSLKAASTFLLFGATALCTESIVPASVLYERASTSTQSQPPSKNENDAAWAGLITAAHYCAFLNERATTDFSDLYNFKMGDDADGCSFLTCSGTPGNYHYAVTAGKENAPATYLTAFSATQFSNWLKNAAECTAGPACDPALASSSMTFQILSLENSNKNSASSSDDSNDAISWEEKLTLGIAVLGIAIGAYESRGCLTCPEENQHEGAELPIPTRIQLQSRNLPTSYTTPKRSPNLHIDTNFCFGSNNGSNTPTPSRSPWGLTHVYSSVEPTPLTVSNDQPRSSLKGKQGSMPGPFPIIGEEKAPSKKTITIHSTAFVYPYDPFEEDKVFLSTSAREEVYAGACTQTKRKLNIVSETSELIPEKVTAMRQMINKETLASYQTFFARKLSSIAQEIFQRKEELQEYTATSISRAPSITTALEEQRALQKEIKLLEQDYKNFHLLKILKTDFSNFPAWENEEKYHAFMEWLVEKELKTRIPDDCPTFSSASIDDFYQAGSEHDEMDLLNCMTLSLMKNPSLSPSSSALRKRLTSSSASPRDAREETLL